MTMSVEDRFLVTNRWDKPEINVVDLYTGAVWTQDLGSGVPESGGIAINRGWENPGLMAVHARDAIVVYWFDPLKRSLRELSRIAATGPQHAVPPYQPEAGAVVWSAIALMLSLQSVTSATTCAMIRVSDCGRHLEIESQLTICDLGEGVRDNHVLDLLTANGSVLPPADYQSPCPRSTGTLPCPS